MLELSALPSPVVSAIALDLTFSPRWWSFISPTRLIIEQLCRHALGDRPQPDQIAVAAHELLENAVKYSASPEGLVRITLDFEGAHVRLRVGNFADADSLATLARELANVNQGDPFEAYLRVMQRCVEQEGSQLGLGRVRYECEAELSMESDNGYVVVQARFARPRQQGD